MACIMKKDFDIAMIALSNGPYNIFIKSFLESYEKYFLPNYKKRYFIITDEDFEHDDNCEVFLTTRYGWPLDCLLRPEYGYKLSRYIKNSSFTYFFNINMVCSSEVGEEILPDESGLVGVEHPGTAGKDKSCFFYCRNPETLAYIPMDQGKVGYQACWWGGTTKAYLTLSKTIMEWVNEDMAKGVEPVFLDNCYLDKYFLLHPPKTMSVAYAWPVHFPNPPKEIKMSQLEKMDYIKGNFRYI